MQDKRWYARFDKHGNVELREAENPHRIVFSQNSDKRLAFAFWETSQATPEEALAESERNILDYVKQAREGKRTQAGLAAAALMLLGIREAREKGHI